MLLNIARLLVLVASAALLLIIARNPCAYSWKDIYICGALGCWGVIGAIQLLQALLSSRVSGAAGRGAWVSRVYLDGRRKPQRYGLLKTVRTNRLILAFLVMVYAVVATAFVLGRVPWYLALPPVFALGWMTAKAWRNRDQPSAVPARNVVGFMVLFVVACAVGALLGWRMIAAKLG